MNGPVIMICDGCECLFPEEKLIATDDGRALLCRTCICLDDDSEAES